MNDDQKKVELTKLITGVMSFYKQDVSKFAMDVWQQVCQRYEVEQVRKAFTAHTMDAERGHFPPKPADLVRALEGTATDRAMLAWGKALEAVSAVGSYSDVVFDDPAIHAVVEDLGGWPKLCRTETADLSYTQHRFCEAYRAYAHKGSFEYPRALRGARSPDHEFARHGLPVPKPAVVGNIEAARQVYLLGNAAGKTAIFKPDLQGLATDVLLRLAHKGPECPAEGREHGASSRTNAWQGLGSQGLQKEAL